MRWIPGILLSVCAAAAQTRPNVVVFLSDDHGRRDASIYGAAAPLKTPTLDRLAKEGMVFDNAFVASPACAPSRAAMLTGLMPIRNGAEANHTYPKDSLAYLPRRLKAAGYRAAAFGKVGHVRTAAEVGFEHWGNVPKRGDLGGAVAKWYDGLADKSKPMWIMVGDERPHVSWTPTPAYKAADISLPPGFIDTKETREHYARYLTDVTAMDAEMGKVYDWARAKFGDNLIFMYSSDHGGQWPFGKWNLYDAGIRVPMVFAAPGRIAAGTRSQAMVSWVDILPTLFDWAGLAVPQGLDGRSFKGVLTGAAAAHRDHVFATHSGDGQMNVLPMRGVRTAKYKYILNPYPQYYHSNHSDIDRLDGAGAYWDSWDSAAARDSAAANIRYRYYVRSKEEFYSLDEDPYEQRNLIGKGTHPAQIAELRKRVADWLAANKDTVALYGKPYPIAGPRPQGADTIRPWPITVSLSRRLASARAPEAPWTLSRGSVDEAASPSSRSVRPDGRSPVSRARPR